MRQGYGLTEVGVNCFSMTDEDALRKAGSVGKPIFHSRMRLVDSDGRDVPDGETGELVIAGPHVCAGYWRNPRLQQNHWLMAGSIPATWHARMMKVTSTSPGATRI
jgi:acyl-CoA synthetase (AMP-forming)/AMP-acid ligase II